MRRLIFAVALMTAGGAPAWAADVVMPDAAVAQAASQPSWSGFYLGALFGYDWGRSDIFGPDIDIDGIGGGAYVGANYQLDRLVLGGEADLALSGADGSSAGLAVDQGLNGSLRARAGIALDRFLLFGTAGVAATRLEVDNGGGGDDSATLFGWTAGAGGETMLTENISARVEYRYTDYQDKDFTLGGGSVEADLRTHQLRAGVGVKF